MSLFLSMDILFVNLTPSRRSPIGRRLPDVSCVLVFQVFHVRKVIRKKLTIILICI